MICKGQSIREPRQNFWKNKGQLCLREFIAFARKIRDIHLRNFGKNKGQGPYKKYWVYTMTELLFWCQQKLVINLTGHPVHVLAKTTRQGRKIIVQRWPKKFVLGCIRACLVSQLSQLNKCKAFKCLNGCNFLNKRPRGLKHSAKWLYQNT